MDIRTHMRWPPAATAAVPGSRAHTSSLIPTNGHTHVHTHNVCWKDRLEFPQTADVNVTLAVLTWARNSKQLVTEHPVSCRQHKAGQGWCRAHLGLVNMHRRYSCSFNSAPRLTISWSAGLTTTAPRPVSSGISQSRHARLSVALASDVFKAVQQEQRG